MTPRTCPDCTGKLIQLEESGHWECVDCGWQGIDHDVEGVPI